MSKSHSPSKKPGGNTRFGLGRPTKSGLTSPWPYRHNKLNANGSSQQTQPIQTVDGAME